MKHISFLCLFVVACGEVIPFVENENPYKEKPLNGVEILAPIELIEHLKETKSYLISENTKYFYTDSEDVHRSCGPDTAACYFSKPKTIIIRNEPADRALERCVYMVHELTHDHLFNLTGDPDSHHIRPEFNTNLFYTICLHFLDWNADTQTGNGKIQ